MGNASEENAITTKPKGTSQSTHNGVSKGFRHGSQSGDLPKPRNSRTPVQHPDYDHGRLHIRPLVNLHPPQPRVFDFDAYGRHTLANLLKGKSYDRGACTSFAQAAMPRGNTGADFSNAEGRANQRRSNDFAASQGLNNNDMALAIGGRENHQLARAYTPVHPWANLYDGTGPCVPDWDNGLPILRMKGASQRHRHSPYRHSKGCYR